MKVDLYAVICESLDMLIEDFDCGDIGLPIFASKVERMLGRVSLVDMSNKHGFEWTVLDQGKGYDLYYASDTHRALMQIRLVDGSRYVHALIKHDDTTETETVRDAEIEHVPEPATSVAPAPNETDTGCDDPECLACQLRRAIEKSGYTLENAGVNVIPMGGSVIPEGTLLSFGRLKRDEN